MASFTVEEVLSATDGVLASGSARGRIRRCCTDTRSLQAGDLYVALKGSNFDGHQFVGEALKRGARGAVVEQSVRSKVLATLRTSKSQRKTDSPILIRVTDTLRAYQELAAYHRRRFHIPVVAVTGSNGKTTTKDMVASTLKARWHVLKTQGNLNNSIGLPHTLLRLSQKHEVAVVEMGVDQCGQTTRLCEIAKPTLGIITNIGPDHLEFFGTLDGSAEAKAELLACLPNDGTIVLNADDAYFGYLRKRAQCSSVSFGFSPKAQVRASGVTVKGKQTTFQVHFPGRIRSPHMMVNTQGAHNIANALAALAVGHVLGMPMKNMAWGLARFRPAAMRSQVRHVHGVTILHDCYNANPASVKAAANWLRELGGGNRTIAVLGDMLELGKNAKALHREVGAYVAEQGTSYLIACGPLGREFSVGARAAGMAPSTVVDARDVEEAAAKLQGLVRKGDVILLKGSRGARMEKILDGFCVSRPSLRVR